MATTAAATSFLENRLLSYIFKNNAASFSSPGDNLFVGLATAVTNFSTSGESGEPSITEATFINYARQQVASSAWTLTSDTADTQICTNSNNIDFPASGGGSIETITHAFIATHASNSLDTLGSGGNVPVIGALNESKTVANGDIFRINATNLSIELK